MKSTARSYKPNHRSIRKISGALVPFDALEHGASLFGLTNGQFSCAELLAWILDQTGAADVYISTWSVGMSEARWLGDQLRGGDIRTLRVLVDRSWPTRHEKFCEALVDSVGAENIRLLRTHAKIMVVRNDAWAVVVRGSLNFNPNPRLEHFDLDDNFELADWIIGEVFTGAFEALPDVMAGNTKRHENYFRDMFDAPEETDSDEPEETEDEMFERLISYAETLAEDETQHHENAT